LDREVVESPASDIDIGSDGSFFTQSGSFKKFELYIPAPPTASHARAFLYHAATRNFFAWIFGKSLVGIDLGSALVELLNSIVEFRSKNQDHVQDIVNYMDEEGYADMRNCPDHALAVLYLAEHFHFRDMWIDAFAHCTGMSERLPSSPGLAV